MRRTKIICTLGPADDREEILESLMLAGMDCARFNFSHGTHAEHKERMDRVKALRKKHGLNTAILLDTKGPEIRTRGIAPEGVAVAAEQRFVFGAEGQACDAALSFPLLYKNVKSGDTVLYDDGAIAFTVQSAAESGIVCIAGNGGTVKDHKSVNVPNVDVEMEYLSEADKADLLFGIEQDVDFVAASFVRSKEDVLALRHFLNENGGNNIQIIAKIENTRGVENLEEIMEIADGIMVARGDLGVEIRFSHLPRIQKEIIEKCYRAGKHVVTATQMLESMVSAPRPTRAEVSDIANAVFDGTTAIMLSGESASGAYPVESLRTMAEIAEEAERAIDYKQRFLQKELELGEDIPSAIAVSACQACFALPVKSIVTLSRSGYTARLISSFRPGCPIIAPSMNERVARQLNLTWGVRPILCEEQFDYASLFHMAADKALETGLLKEGDLAVITGSITGMKNTDIVHIHRM